MLAPQWAKPERSRANGNCVEARWAKSTHSESGNCVETRWRKSARSAYNGNCAEARTDSGRVQVRDSKDPGPVLSFTPAAWQAFLAEVKA